MLIVDSKIVISHWRVLIENDYQNIKLMGAMWYVGNEQVIFYE